MADAPERIWAEEVGTATKGGQSFRIGRWITDETVSHPHEYIRADVARADAELAVALVVERGAERMDEGFSYNAGNAIRSLAPADALAEVQWLLARVTSLSEQVDTIAEQRDTALAERDSFRAVLEGACYGDIGGIAKNTPETSRMLGEVVAKRSLDFRARAEKAEAERDAALAEVQRLREENDRLKSLLTPPDDVPWVTCDAIIHGSAALDRFSGDEPLVPADALNVARAERDAALARVEKLREARRDQMEARVEAVLRRNFVAPEDAAVEALCLRFGYGAVMDAASRLWARTDMLGAFYVGGCIGFRTEEEARAALDEDTRHG